MKPARATPYGPKGAFPAQALLYTPHAVPRLPGGRLQLESRFYLSSSRWQEEALWMLPFVTTGDGKIAWASNQDASSRRRVRPPACDQTGAVVRLIRIPELPHRRRAACRCPTASLGGFGVAAIPKTSHSLLKVEVRAVNWGRVAITHFRPGGTTAKAYRTRGRSRQPGQRLHRLRRPRDRQRPPIASATACWPS